METDIFFFLLSFLFVFLCLVLVATVWSSNPVTMILFLVLAFILAFLILLLLGLEFLATIFLIIYAGAISILFMFVIMMINLKFHLAAEYSYYINFLFLFLALIGITLFAASKILRNFYIFNWIEILYFRAELAHIGYCIYNFFFFHLFLLTYILLLAMIGAIALVFTVNVNLRGQHRPQLKKKLGETFFLFSD